MGGGEVMSPMTPSVFAQVPHASLHPGPPQGPLREGLEDQLRVPGSRSRQRGDPRDVQREWGRAGAVRHLPIPGGQRQRGQRRLPGGGPVGREPQAGREWARTRGARGGGGGGAHRPPQPTPGGCFRPTRLLCRRWKPCSGQGRPARCPHPCAASPAGQGSARRW